MKIEHISIFLPQNTPFYRRLYRYLSHAFLKHGINVSGLCKLLNQYEMDVWLDDIRPDAVFEMNRVKDEIPILHERKVPHISWVVDFQGRTEAQIKGSEITYFFDPGWDANYQTGGIQDWLPPGTCTRTFRPIGERSAEVAFNFIGHIPLPWSDEELSRKITECSDLTFGELLQHYECSLKTTRHEMKTHKDLKNIADGLVEMLTGEQVELADPVYYDLMERTKRLKNRTELLNMALTKSDSLAIYGSSNWKHWTTYAKFYKWFVDDPYEINFIHQNGMINLHDGVSFHFRAIDCLASGGLLFWYDNRESEQNSVIKGRGLHDYFEDGFHYFSFKQDAFDEIYHGVINSFSKRMKAIFDAKKLIETHHTWEIRAEKIIRDLTMV